MSLSNKPTSAGFFGSAKHGLTLAARNVGGFMRQNWKGTLVFATMTLVFFWPVVIQMGSYSPGGDAMFNAWEMRRNQNCILRQHCPVYTDANIYYPNKDTMLYSETQLSAGAVTLPLYWINQNPLFAYNLLTILSFFLAGWFMYLLAKRLSKGSEFWAILAGIAFEFAPVRIASIYHLQNLSILCLPLAVLLIIRFFDTYQLRKIPPAIAAARSRRTLTMGLAHAAIVKAGIWARDVYRESLPGKKYLIGLFLALLYVFFASWVQMVFVLFALGVLLIFMLLFKLVRVRPLAAVVVVIGVATLATMPLAFQYVHFAKGNPSTFGLKDQLMYSSSLADYFIPHDGTLLGKAYYSSPRTIVDSYNPDSYSYMGVVLYAAAGALLVTAFRLRKRNEETTRNYKAMLAFLAVGITGFIISLGPILKVKAGWYHLTSDGIRIVAPLPWLIVDKLLPQLHFIRALGRAAVLVLFMLCCVLAFMPFYLKYIKNKKYVYIIMAAAAVLVVVELVPIHQIPMAKGSYSYDLTIPPVYQYVKAHKEVDNIIILVTDYDYPNAPIPIARAEQVLWSGYYNRNIFNGYSGIDPPHYIPDQEDYNDFYPNDVPKLKARGIQYVIVDKQLSKNHPDMPVRVNSILHKGEVYSDKRYDLYKLP
jgi:hypothetical protein